MDAGQSARCPWQQEKPDHVLPLRARQTSRGHATPPTCDSSIAPRVATCRRGPRSRLISLGSHGAYTLSKRDDPDRMALGLPDEDGGGGVVDIQSRMNVDGPLPELGKGMAGQALEFQVAWALTARGCALPVPPLCT